MRNTKALSAGSPAPAPFIPPANFKEYHERYPNNTRHFLLDSRRNCPFDAIDEMAQELDLFLMSASPRMRENGIEDRIATYDASALGHGTEGAFFYYIKLILTRQYSKLISRSKSEPSGLSRGVPFESDEWVQRTYGVNLTHAPREKQHTKMFVEGFYAHLELRGHKELVEVAKAFSLCDQLDETAKTLGLSRKQLALSLNTLRHEAQCYRLGDEAISDSELAPKARRKASRHMPEPMALASGD